MSQADAAPKSSYRQISGIAESLAARHLKKAA